MQLQRLWEDEMSQPDHTVPKSTRGLQFGQHKMNTMPGDPGTVHFRTDMLN